MRTSFDIVYPRSEDALRRRLPPQPGGFEGLGVGQVVPHSRHPSRFQLVDLADIQLDRHPAPFSGCGLVSEPNHSVIARIDQLEPNRPEPKRGLDRRAHPRNLKARTPRWLCGPPLWLPRPDGVAGQTPRTQ